MSDESDELAKWRLQREIEQEAADSVAVAECAGCGGPIELSVEDEAWIEEVFNRATRPEEVRIKLLRPTSKAPQYMTAGAAGADVFADFGGIGDAEKAFGSSWGGSFWHEGGLTEVVLTQGTIKIPLGFAIEIPAGHVGILKGRSGLASQGHDAHVAFIDADYRGECCMLLHVGDGSVNIRHGDRVGQIAIVPAPQYVFRAVDELSETERGAKGFGSSGVR